MSEANSFYFYDPPHFLCRKRSRMMPIGVDVHQSPMAAARWMHPSQRVSRSSLPASLQARQCKTNERSEDPVPLTVRTTSAKQLLMPNRPNVNLRHPAVQRAPLRQRMTKRNVPRIRHNPFGLMWLSRLDFLAVYL